jgi:hypothetical protein
VAIRLANITYPPSKNGATANVCGVDNLVPSIIPKQCICVVRVVHTAVIQHQNIDTDQKHPAGENETSLSDRTGEKQVPQPHDGGDNG